MTDKKIRDRLYDMYKNGHVITQTETGKYTFPYCIEIYFPDDEDMKDLKEYLDRCYNKLKQLSQ